MRKFLAVLYTSLALGANALLSGPAAAEGLEALRQGEMRKLEIHDAPVELPDFDLLTLEDAPAKLSEYRGKWVVLNLWATWCAPCRKEMPSLDRLQAAMPEIAVVPVAVMRNDPNGIRRFYETAGIENLPVRRDAGTAVTATLRVMALPVTVILDPEGREVARLIGDAEWDSADAQAILKALAAGG